MKALVLLSGGLDSLLAVKLMLEQGIEVEALHFTTMFCQCDTSKSGCLSEANELKSVFNVPIKNINSNDSFLEIVKNPRHGYGSNMNPCIDCRINMLSTAGRYMRESGASFLVTGEVLGQRPMSQHRRALDLIEKETGLQGLILRPLSAGLLEPTIPEKSGWIDRAKLLNIKGRSRKPQMALAEMFKMKDYPCPAGGCLLTDPGFSSRVRDLLKYSKSPTTNDFLLLKNGRHFRIDANTKAVIGRDEQDNKVLTLRKQSGDLLMEIKDFVGPVTILRGDLNPSNVELAAALTARYSDMPDNGQKATVIITRDSDEKDEQTGISPLNHAQVDKYLIKAKGQ
ncbi:MAG: hypothetical protein WC980_04240 [Candidatus Brocadiia bacterium]